MTFNQLKYFTALVESNSFTDAAKSLFITQPALSRQIQAMEEELCLTLLIRESRSFKLTPSGAILYKKFKEILNSYEDSIDKAILASKGFDGKIIVEVLDVLDISNLFPPLLRLIKERHPNLELTFKRRSLRGLTDDLSRGHADIILTYGFSLFNQAGLVTSDIGHFNSCLMIPRTHPLALRQNNNPKALSLEDFAHDTFIQLKPSVCEDGARYLDRLWNQAGIYPTTRWVDSMSDIMLWVETGNGISITTDVSTEKNNPNVQVFPIETPEAKGHTVSFAWKKDNYNPAIALFMEQVDATGFIYGDINCNG